MIPYMVGKLAPNSSHLTSGLVKYVSGRGYFRAVSSQNWDKSVTSPPPPLIVERVCAGRAPLSAGVTARGKRVVGAAGLCTARFPLETNRSMTAAVRVRAVQDSTECTGTVLNSKPYNCGTPTESSTSTEHGTWKCSENKFRFC